MRIYDIEEAERQTTRVRRHIEMGAPDAAANEFAGFIDAQNVFTQPVDASHIPVLADYFKQWAFLVSLPIEHVEIIWDIWKDSITVNAPTLGTGNKEGSGHSPKPTGRSTK